MSVVLPVYNGEKYLKEAITSVLSQTYTDFELILVNDGSVDKSGKIADDFKSKDNRIKVIHQKNEKLPAALNAGFNMAKGEFYTWISADNRMLPGFLETFVSELNRDTSCHMIYGNMKLIDEKGNLLRGKGWYEKPPLSGNIYLPDSTNKLNVVANNTIGAAFMYRSFAAKCLCGYLKSMFLLEDYDYFMRMNSFFKIKHTVTSRSLYEYRMHDLSLTAKDKDLGITASRPRLMTHDANRRQKYLMPNYYYLNKKDKDIETRLLKTGYIIKDIKDLHKLASLGVNPIYIDFNNERNLLNDKNILTINIIKDNQTNAYTINNQVKIKTSQDTAAFIAIYAKDKITADYN